MISLYQQNVRTPFGWAPPALQPSCILEATTSELGTAPHAAAWKRHRKVGVCQSEGPIVLSSIMLRGQNGGKWPIQPFSPSVNCFCRIQSLILSASVLGMASCWALQASWCHSLRSQIPRSYATAYLFLLRSATQNVPSNRNKKLLGAPGIATRSIHTTSNKKLLRQFSKIAASLNSPPASRCGELMDQSNIFDLSR